MKPRSAANMQPNPKKSGPSLCREARFAIRATKNGGTDYARIPRRNAHVEEFTGARVFTPHNGEFAGARLYGDRF
jgi:hypothetical protein